MWMGRRRCCCLNSVFLQNLVAEFLCCRAASEFAPMPLSSPGGASASRAQFRQTSRFATLALRRESCRATKLFRDPGALAGRPKARDYAAMKTRLAKKSAAACVIGVALASAASAAPATQKFVYTVHHSRYGNIGTFTNTVLRDGDDTTVTTQIRIAVSILGVTLYRGCLPPGALEWRPARGFSRR